MRNGIGCNKTFSIIQKHIMYICLLKFLFDRDANNLDAFLYLLFSYLCYMYIFFQPLLFGIDLSHCVGNCNVKTKY